MKNFPLSSFSSYLTHLWILFLITSQLEKTQRKKATYHSRGAQMKPLIVSSVLFLFFLMIFSHCSKDSNSVVASAEKDKNVNLQKKDKWPKKIYDSTYGENCNGLQCSYTIGIPMRN